MQLQPIMRKKVNILFVVLAIMSVTYGMILKYSNESVPELAEQELLTPEEVVVSYDDDIVDLDALTGNPD